MSSDSNDRTPWEDSIILAFRDMQWMRRQNANYEALVSALRQSDTLEGETLLKNFLIQTRTPPPLLAKLDGHAETASGDTLTAINQRFFLLEFKASKGKLRTEKKKFMHELMTFVDPVGDRHFVDLSRQGHFVVYPTFPKAPPLAQQGFLPVHESRLETQPYLDALRGKQLLPPGDKRKHIAPAKADEVLWDASQGLTLEEMACYLDALCYAHSEDGSTHPMKAVIATPDGIFWPIADLSQLLHLAQHFQVSPSASKLSLQFVKGMMRMTMSKFRARGSQKTLGTDNKQDKSLDSGYNSSPAP
ncbi:hypothetical protein P5705_19255 [Pseudomonas entomophila]|uniref:hypothetical protein n=1 Tax=Pseudomonas entomophila TaxID=312306 RepID=UPI002405387C|nr:hypothetical protein [Pseudomonas entomophila]MDF9619791.1 hypothetical protein [Pseudomonas entomophila]